MERNSESVTLSSRGCIMGMGRKKTVLKMKRKKGQAKKKARIQKLIAAGKSK